MTAQPYQGVYTAMVTPFTDDASTIDYAAYEKLLEKQIEGGVAGVVPCGTTGETPTLSSSEQLELIRATRRIVGKRATIIAGAGSNATQKSVDAVKAAVEAGADAVMIVMPYYSKPSQAGMIRHVELIAKAVTAPIVLYNIPSRSVVELSVESTLALLSSCPNVVAVKDATGKLSYSQNLLRHAAGRVALLSGDDALTLPMLAVGATGVISVASNLYPKAVVRVVTAAVRGDYVAARREHFRLLPVFDALFDEPSPAPIKAALASKGWLRESVRSPIVPISADCRERLLSAMRTFEESSEA
jgi:4-hydroxy-tetrahydrodipicolinate synthase